MSNSRINFFEKHPRFYNAQNHEAYTYIDLLINKLSKAKLDTSIETKISQDAMVLMDYLTTPVTLKRTQREVKDGKVVYRAKEEVISDNSKYLQQNIPHVIFFPGNNDLTQVEEAMFLLHKLKVDLTNKLGQKEAETIVSKIPIVVSGLGGHGVTAGPIFASSEASAIGHYIEKFLQYKYCDKNRIYLEEKATNTGANVELSKPYMQLIESKAILTEKSYKGLKIWLAPSPCGGLRQVATFSQQAEPGYKVSEVYLLANKKNIQKKYFSINKTDSIINLFAALRETVSHLSYMIDSDFMSSHAPNSKQMKDAIDIVVDYYIMLNSNCIPENFSKVLKDGFVAFSKQKEKAGGLQWLNSESQHLADMLSVSFKPIKVYFQTVFKQVERQHMDHLGDMGLKPYALEEQYTKTKQYKSWN